MSTDNQSKINQLLASQPAGIVLQASWLTRQGYSRDLQRRYRQSRWLDALGTGAFIRSGDHVGYEGALYALQKQTGSHIHPAGRTALAFLGKSHYLDLSPKKAMLFGPRTEKLPAWFKNHDWGITITYHPSSFLPPDAGLTEVDVPRKTFSIKISNAPRALMECLYLAPQEQDLVECYQLMEGLNNLRPDLVQQLLEACRSVKVKRLFLYLADKARHSWVDHLDLTKIDLGSGKRSLVADGTYVPKYEITVPRELEAHVPGSL